MLGISQEILKLIACLSMLIDHIGHVFLPKLLLRLIGRLAFPIYAFLLCQGLTHTKNPGKYALRMSLMLVLSELPYDILFYGKIDFAHQNVMFTLLLGLLMGLCIRKTPSRILQILWVIPFGILANLLHSDYGSYGICIIALFLFSPYTPRPRLLEALGLIILGLFMSKTAIVVAGFRIPTQLFAVFSLIPIALYNGKKSTPAPALQWAFYLFYPVHLVILYLVDVFLSSNC